MTPAIAEAGASEHALVTKPSGVASMRFTRRMNGYALAVVAGAMFLAAPMAPADSEKTTGHCAGVNSCRGHSSCKTAANSCKGQNSCKGKGFVELTKQQCDQVGGVFEPDEKKP